MDVDLHVLRVNTFERLRPRPLISTANGEKVWPTFSKFRRMSSSQSYHFNLFHHNLWTSDLWTSNPSTAESLYLCALKKTSLKDLRRTVQTRSLCSFQQKVKHGQHRQHGQGSVRCSLFSLSTAWLVDLVVSAWARFARMIGWISFSLWGLWGSVRPKGVLEPARTS